MFLWGACGIYIYMYMHIHFLYHFICDFFFSQNTEYTYRPKNGSFSVANFFFFVTKRNEIVKHHACLYHQMSLYVIFCIFEQFKHFFCFCIRTKSDQKKIILTLASTRTVQNLGDTYERLKKSSQDKTNITKNSWNWFHGKKTTKKWKLLISASIIFMENVSKIVFVKCYLFDFSSFFWPELFQN